MPRGDGWSVVPSGLVRGWLGPSTSCWAMFVRPCGALCEDPAGSCVRAGLSCDGRSGVFPIRPSDKCRGGTGGQSSLRDLFVAGCYPALRAGLCSCVPTGLCARIRVGSCVRAGLLYDGRSGVFLIRPFDKCRGDGWSVVPSGLVRGWLLPSTSCWAMFVRPCGTCVRGSGRVVRPFGTLCEDPRRVVRSCGTFVRGSEPGSS